MGTRRKLESSLVNKHNVIAELTVRRSPQGEQAGLKGSVRKPFQINGTRLALYRTRSALT